MKTGNSTRTNVSRLIRAMILIANILFIGLSASAQCGVGYSQSQVNWDNLDYLVTTGNYSGFVSTAMANSQNFALGPNRVTINLSSNMNPGGENGTHTGELAGFTGDDVQFTPSGSNQTITITFDNEVMNANFTLYDVDRQASITVTAANALLLPLSPTITTQTGTILTLGGLPISPTITASNTNVANNLNTASATIRVAGPVKTITLTITNPGSDAIFWLSDINACVTGSFPTNYFAVSRPFNGGMAGGQPAYFLNLVDDSVYITDPSNGRSKFLFTDAASIGKINSVGYDPYNHIMYFVYSLTGSASTNKTLRKYDFNTETFSTITTNITTLVGIPTFDQGVESGAAAFYNGSLYLGVEASNSGRNSGREHIIWRIDFNSSGVPYRSSQVAATPSDGGGTLLHDWSDCVISNGILYDFDGAQASPNIYHYDLMTGARTVYVPSFRPTQAAVTWDERVFEVGSNSTALYDAGHVQPYNYDGTVNTAQNFALVQPPSTTIMGSWGDASEAFRPKSDFGDAPASYDPVALAPATHEYDPLIRLGASYDYEWNLTSSALASADGSDEDGIGAAPALNFDATLTYSVTISVFNNTGANATMIAWLDYNFNGVFEAGEGRSITVPSSNLQQSRTITWSSIYVPLTTNVRTFLRIRVTRGANGMTTANMNGWYPDGEVEDYPVLMGVALPKDVLTITAEKTPQSTVQVDWKTRSDIPISSYEVLRSSNNQTWETIAQLTATQSAGQEGNYSYNDIRPVQGTSYYRIKVNYATPDLANKLTDIRSVKIDGKPITIRVQPNPVASEASVIFTSPAFGTAVIELYDGNGKVVLKQASTVYGGQNTVALQRVSTLAPGTYTVRVNIGGEQMISKFVKTPH